MDGRAAVRISRIVHHIYPDSADWSDNKQLITINTDASPKDSTQDSVISYLSQTITDTKSFSRLVSTSIQMNFAFRRANRRVPYTTADTWEDIVKYFVWRTALFYQDKHYTFEEINWEANKIAHWADAQGIKQGMTVALLMGNRPEFYFTWLGLCKVGATIALINTI
eukprot:TRINITY_DN7565_c0_g1_i3.p1 TRINITY_DN7565_c0_g1~~TRINITY_DN7565_c0_g1_i3.p1  ORF type:complete len:167 (-),score=14.49 TRINITY_DN7565_c0_g1_i3:506-1006(-)